MNRVDVTVQPRELREPGLRKQKAVSPPPVRARPKARQILLPRSGATTIAADSLLPRNVPTAREAKVIGISRVRPSRRQTAQFRHCKTPETTNPARMPGQPIESPPCGKAMGLIRLPLPLRIKQLRIRGPIPAVTKTGPHQPENPANKVWRISPNVSSRANVLHANETIVPWSLPTRGSLQK